MRLIQQYLPNPRHTEINRIFVKAKPADAWEYARHFDAATIPWVRLLFDIRALPDLLRGVVAGSVGQFWHLNIPFATVAPADFRDLQEPGWGKLAWSISVEPYGEGSTIALELRTTATDDASWEKLNRYYLLIGLGSQPIRRSAMSHIAAELGKLKTPDEDDVVLPGDEHLPSARYSLNHKKDIEAPPELMWRYLCDRAGWYSIDALDHEGIPSTDYLVEGWQTRRVGDKVAATLAIDNFYEVLAGGRTRTLPPVGRRNGSHRRSFCHDLGLRPPTCRSRRLPTVHPCSRRRGAQMEGMAAGRLVLPSGARPNGTHAIETYSKVGGTGCQVTKSRNHT